MGFGTLEFSKELCEASGGNKVNKPSTNMRIDQINQQIRTLTSLLGSRHEERCFRRSLVDSAWQSCIYSAVNRNSVIPVDNHNRVCVCVCACVRVCVCALWVKHRTYVRSILSTTTTAWHNIRLLSTIHLIRTKLYPRSRNIQHTPRLGRLIWDLPVGQAESFAYKLCSLHRLC